MSSRILRSGREYKPLISPEDPNITNKNPTNSIPKKCYLLALPSELLVMIYERVFARTALNMRFWNETSDAKRTLWDVERQEIYLPQEYQFLRVNRQVYQQAGPILYAQVDVTINFTSKTLDQAWQLVRHRNLMRYVSLGGAHVSRMDLRVMYSQLPSIRRLHLHLGMIDTRSASDQKMVENFAYSTHTWLQPFFDRLRTICDISTIISARYLKCDGDPGYYIHEVHIYFLGAR